MSNDLNALLNAARPFKEFKVTVGESEFIYFARKAAYADSQGFQDIWDKTYAETLTKTDEQSIDGKALYANLKRQPVERLAKFVARAERPDMLSDAASLLDKPTSDPEVIQRADDAMQEREAELKNAPHDEVLDRAMERRAHFYAVNQANEALTRAMAKAIIFRLDGEKHVPLFPTLQAVEDFPVATIEAIVDAALKALTPKGEEPNPLPQAAPESSEKPSESPSASAAA